MYALLWTRIRCYRNKGSVLGRNDLSLRFSALATVAGRTSWKLNCPYVCLETKLIHHFQCCFDIEIGMAFHSSSYKWHSEVACFFNHFLPLFFFCSFARFKRNFKAIAWAKSLSCCDSCKVMSFLRFSALGGMPRRTSWWLNACSGGNRYRPNFQGR